MQELMGILEMEKVWRPWSVVKEVAKGVEEEEVGEWEEVRMGQGWVQGC